MDVQHEWSCCKPEHTLSLLHTKNTRTSWESASLTGHKASLFLARCRDMTATHVNRADLICSLPTNLHFRQFGFLIWEILVSKL